MVKLPPEWSELIASLCAARVRFLIVGAHALAVHGRPRATGDLDVLVDPTPANARRVAAALRAFGFPALARRRAAFATPDRMATLGRPPLRIDIMTSISGNKRAAGRPKDLLDVALLEEGVRRRRPAKRRR